MEHPILTLVTINTWKCDGSYSRRMEALKKGLKGLNPCIIACQEVFQSEEANQDTVRELATFLRMNASCVPSRLKDRSVEGNLVKSYSGLALLSRYPILKTWTLPLPTDERDGERIAQYCLIDWDAASGAQQSSANYPVLVINTHLTHLKDMPLLRKQQLEAIINYLPSDERYSALFLCGDLNAAELSEEMNFLLNHSKVSALNGYRAGKGRNPGFTVMPQLGENRQESEGKTIDFIVSLAEKGNPHPEILSAAVVLHEPDEQGIYPSDHFGVMISAQIAPVRGE
ncbi:MAG: endonuclease/exonuclease/phosphatase family protein [Bacteroidota bacterium]